MALADSKKAKDTAKKSRKPVSNGPKNVPQKDQLVVPPSSIWHANLPPLPSSSAPCLTPNADQITPLMEKGASLLEKDTQSFLSASTSSSEASFFTKVVHSGTLSDRLSALTLLVQSSPIHNVKALDTLKAMSGKGGGGRDESLKALRCIVDWWVGGGAPNRKLKYFRDQQLLHPQVSDEYILIWYFEDWLKKYFFSILQILETLSLDPLPYVRTQAMSFLFTLLRDKPEQEQNLLRLLVNKLGDTSKSICSRASHHLLQLLQAHPSMKSVVVREITSLILKPSIRSTASAPTPQVKHIRFSPVEPSRKSKQQSKIQDKKPLRNAHAQYYATITFNQIVLTPSQTDREVATRLIDIYFELFADVLGSEPDETGRADLKSEQILGKNGEVQQDRKGRIFVKNKKKKGNTGKEVNGAAGFVEVEDSNSKLISALLTGVNRALPFTKDVTSEAKINAHLDTLFLITHKSTFNISLQALVLVEQISLELSKTSPTTAKPIMDRYFRTLYDSLYDSRLGTSSKQAMYLNLLYKSIKNDPEHSPDRKKALIKRFVQVLISGGSSATEFVAGGLYLLGELFSTVPGLRSMIFDEQRATNEDETYDPRKRDPLYARAGNSPIWELTPLLHHYHPAISLLARQLLAAQPLTATADLTQNTLSHFLDRFVYKNPKKKLPGIEGKGTSAMQPAGSAVEGVKLRKGEVPSAQVNQPAFWKKQETQIPVDQLFFYNYFKRKDEAARKAKKPELTDGGSEEEDEAEAVDNHSQEGDLGIEGELEVGDSEDSEIEEDEIWKTMKATMPKDGDEDQLVDETDFEDDEDLPSDFSAKMASEDGAPYGSSQETASTETSESEEDPNTEDERGDDSDALSLAENSDNDDLVPIDEIPDGLLAYAGSDSEGGEDNEEWKGINREEPRKRKRRAEVKEKGNKRLRSLPTFASYEEYAKLIEEGPEDDI